MTPAENNKAVTRNALNQLLAAVRENLQKYALAGDERAYGATQVMEAKLLRKLAEHN